jgi:hypothetical protein
LRGNDQPEQHAHHAPEQGCDDAGADDSALILVFTLLEPSRRDTDHQHRQGDKEGRHKDIGMHLKARVRCSTCHNQGEEEPGREYSGEQPRTRRLCDLRPVDRSHDAPQPDEWASAG